MSILQMPTNCYVLCDPKQRIARFTHEFFCVLEVDVRLKIVICTHPESIFGSTQEKDAEVVLFAVHTLTYRKILQEM